MAGNTQSAGGTGTPVSQTVSTNVAELPQFVPATRAVSGWAIIFVLIIELTLFATLISSYFYLRAAVPDWPPGDIPLPDLLFPTLNGLFFLLSVLPVALSVRKIKQGNPQAMMRNLAIACVMGLIFLGLTGYEYSQFAYDWTANVYASLVWTIVIIHGLHVFSGLLMMGAVWVAAYQGIFNQTRHAAVEGNAWFWYFGVAIWVPLYVVLYWSPRWM